MSDHMLYPTEWPGHCINRLIEIGPGGLLERKSEAIKSVLTIIAFFAGKVFGDPDAETVIGHLSQETKNRMANDVDRFLAVFGKDQERPAITGPVSNAVLERLIALILPLLLEWLEDWLAKKD